jgi:hypothetical protein
MGKGTIQFDKDGYPIPQRVKSPIQFDSDGFPIPLKKKRTYIGRHCEAFGWWCRKNAIAFGVWWNGWEICWPVRRRN